MPDFHDILFPMPVGLNASGGPVRRTEIVTLGSGYEERTARWLNSRRYYDAGTGIRTLDDLHMVMEFFEERRGRLHAFRYRDPFDFNSSSPSLDITPLDQEIGVGDGVETAFQLTKAYGQDHAPLSRNITRPVASSVRIAVDGVELFSPTDWSVDETTGIVTFVNPPGSAAVVTAGFLFDVPVRFDTDRLSFDMAAFNAGAIPNIPLVEVRG